MEFDVSKTKVRDLDGFVERLTADYGVQAFKVSRLNNRVTLAFDVFNDSINAEWLV